MMKNRKLGAGLAALCISAGLLTGCGASVEVTYDGGESITVNRGEKLQQPECSEREDYEFLGWYRDAQRTKPWNFETDKVRSDMTLYPLWDAADRAKMTPADATDAAVPSPQEQEDYLRLSHLLPAEPG